MKTHGLEDSRKRLSKAHVVEILEELVYTRQSSWKTLPHVADLLREVVANDPAEDMRHRAAVLLAGAGEQHGYRPPAPAEQHVAAQSGHADNATA